MKKKDVLLLICILAAAGIAGLIIFALRGGEGSYVELTVNGQYYGQYDLDEEQVIEIDTEYGHNVLEIKDGAVTMTEADCPDGYCMDQGSKNKNSQTIVCLPNKVIAEVKSAGGQNQDNIDGIAN